MKPPAVNARSVGFRHETGNALSGAVDSVPQRQLSTNLRCIVSFATFPMDLDNQLLQPVILPYAGRYPPSSPRIVLTGGDAQHTAHGGHGMIALLPLNEGEDLYRLQLASSAKKAAAFFRMWRSSGRM